ncbi:MAG: ATP-binding protein [Kiritimatiellaeota bacterium]|nr:ATP-binding protein [Kiritimatiellota bacterium]
MNLTTLQRIMADFHARPLPALTVRDKPIRFVRDMSLSIVGARRSGKTYRTYQFIKNHIEQGGHIENICRVQFNDHRLSAMKRADLSSVDEAYYALYPEKRGREEVFFVFDEIHRIEGWEDYILHLLDEPLQRVLITGSTSRLLSGEIASSLRGKNMPVALYPFSFREFLRHYKVAPDVMTSRGQGHLRKRLRHYLQQGGFPGLLDADERLHIDLLQTYWDTMVLRDIIEAHPRANIPIAVFSHFAQALVARTACPFTVRAMVGGMREAGLSFTAETIYSYLRFLEEAFMVFTVPVFSPSEKVRQRNYHKVYAVDWALAQAIASAEGVDVSRQLENMVYLELRRRGWEVSYFRTRQGWEIDFVAVRQAERQRPPMICQVAYSMQRKEVRERELRGLAETARHLRATRVTVVTFNDEETVALDGIRVDIIPAWKWLLAEAIPGQ